MSRSENSVAAAEPPHQGCNSAQSLTQPAPLAPAMGLALEPRPNATRPAASFRRRFFPGTTATQWNDWRWQVRNRVTSLNGLARYLRLSPSEERAFSGNSGKLPLGITPYYLSLMDPDNPEDPLRRTMVPTWFEAVVSPGESNDPLGEEHDMAAPGLVHRYPDRVLFLATGFCSAYCRYCTRSRMVGGGSHGLAQSRSDMEQAIAYIEATPSVRDVLISGGDPLTMADDRLEWLLTRLRRIPHVEMLRIGTKTPAVLPQRITKDLVKRLKKYHPLFMSLHFTHPAELTPEAARACARLADAGIPLGSQTVLLAGVNDSVPVMRKLMQGLLKMRVRPYYLYQCDPIAGSGHFRTPVSKGLEMIQGLRGHTTGYGVPTFVIDAPGGGGKVALYPEAVAGRSGCDLLLKNYQGDTYAYPDQGGEWGPAAC
ncbi:MAG: KamA family radical SAM protein [Desulfarculus sp.]|nr:KamA family radical SAM protein [Pseudomonadota bacterium]MBU4576987.1 KamA family radical SAM protein [Pseudomonadota bacterium]MBU4598725.1 KamA family radical SAM protein [Pseudomonadota bacterium]MBV1717428.1 KamA family radical SAM protein [Desulfarculus sp.]MBV1739998.1 KamA family radical SAM protein [Desulfarculus sp.]